eukprot:gnl/MRDRNA2_/MRDRNA2_30692_c0_seq1.p1 gnl/MRDRNA2_/MRDRNA2_30692_c0~~gnl/MRDRNA2_/MRDRNA2_30692_c0_seq1.p1  ORF type:complete len:654 (+),score=102.56 gnl/MRDRNA2_/MRDRNA2_30692_c0_seq1:254-1963(+)
MPDSSSVQDSAMRVRRTYESASALVSTFAPTMKSRGRGHIINVLALDGKDSGKSDLRLLQQYLQSFVVASNLDLVYSSNIRVTSVFPAQIEASSRHAPPLRPEEIADQVLIYATNPNCIERIMDVTLHASEKPRTKGAQRQGAAIHDQSKASMMHTRSQDRSYSGPFLANPAKYVASPSNILPKVNEKDLQASKINGDSALMQTVANLSVNMPYKMPVIRDMTRKGKSVTIPLINAGHTQALPVSEIPKEFEPFPIIEMKNGTLFPREPQVNVDNAKMHSDTSKISRINNFWEVEIAELKRVQMKEHGKPVNSEQFSKDKHVPFLTISGSQARVTVGLGDEDTPYHPMKASEDPEEVHYITHIYVVDQMDTCVAMQMLFPDGSSNTAEMIFDIPAWATKLKPFEYCNKHGLWDGPEVIVPQCQSLSMVKSLDSKCWQSVIAELYRRHKKHHGKQEPFVGSSTEENTPYISFHGNKFRVTVGNGDHPHPMKATTNPVEVHYITHVYAMDQNNSCVGMDALDPTRCDIAQVEFDLPRQATKLTPFGYCNLDGLWVGPTVQVPLGNDTRNGQ